MKKLDILLLIILLLNAFFSIEAPKTPEVSLEEKLADDSQEVIDHPKLVHEEIESNPPKKGNQLETQAIDWITGESINTTVDFANRIIASPGDFHYETWDFDDEITHAGSLIDTYSTVGSLYLRVEDSGDNEYVDARFEGAIYAYRPGTLRYYLIADWYNDTHYASYEPYWSETYQSTFSVSTAYLHSEGILTVNGDISAGSSGSASLRLTVCNYQSGSTENIFTNSTSGLSNGQTVNAIEWQIRQLRYEPDSYSEHIRSEWRETGSPDFIEYRWAWQCPDFMTNATFVLPDYFNTSSIEIEPSTDFEVSSNQLTIYNTVPVTYTLKTTSESQKRYLANLQETTENFLNNSNIGFEGAVDDFTATNSTTLTLNSTIVHSGAFAAKVIAAGNSEIHFDVDDSLAGDYYAGIAYYYESAGTSTVLKWREDSANSSYTLDQSTTNAWTQEFFFIHLEPDATWSISIYLTEAQTLFIDSLHFYEVKATLSNPEYQSLKAEGTLTNWIRPDHLVRVPNAELKLKLYDRTAGTSIIEESTSTNSSGEYSWIVDTSAYSELQDQREDTLYVGATILDLDFSSSEDVSGWNEMDGAADGTWSVTSGYLAQTGTPATWGRLVWGDSDGKDTKILGEASVTYDWNIVTNNKRAGNWLLSYDSSSQSGYSYDYHEGMGRFYHYSYESGATENSDEYLTTLSLSTWYSTKAEILDGNLTYYHKTQAANSWTKTITFSDSDPRQQGTFAFLAYQGTCYFDNLEIIQYTSCHFTPQKPEDFQYFYSTNPNDNEWDFTEGTLEECSRQGGAGTTDTIENGYWKVEPDSSNNIVNYYIGSSTWTVSTSTYTRLILRIKGSEALRFMIYDSGWNVLISYTTISTSYQEFSLDLSADSDWTGNDQIRIQFVETSGGGNFEGTEAFYVDHIRLIHRDSPSLSTESSYAFCTSTNNSLAYRIELDDSLQEYTNDLDLISLDQTDGTHTVNATPYRDNDRDLVFLPGTSITASYVPVDFGILSEDFVIGDYVAQYAITTTKDNDSTAVSITLYLNDTEVEFPDGSTSTTPGVIVFSRPSYGYYNFTRQATWGSQSLTKSWNITVTSNAEVTHLVVSIASDYYTCDWGTNKGTGSLTIYDNDSLIQTDSTEGLSYQQKSTTEGIHLLEFNVTVESRVFSYTANYTVSAWTVTVYLSADQRVAIEDQVTLTVSTVRSDGGDFYGTVVVNGTSIIITDDSGTTTVTNANVGNYSYTVQSVVDNTDRARSFTASNTWIRYDKLFAKLDLLSAETLLPGQAATIYVNMTYMHDDTEVTNTYTYDVYINNQYWQSFESKRQITIPFEKEGTYSIELRDIKDIDYYITEYKSQIVQITVQEPSEETDLLGGLMDPSVLGILTLFGIGGLAVALRQYNKKSGTQKLDKVVTGYDDNLVKKRKGNIMDSDWSRRKKPGNLGRRR